MVSKNNLANKRILVTCGPTWTPIDEVRVISNCSTGKLGHLIAGNLTRAGAKVTLLEGPVRDSLPNKNIKKIKFQFYDDLSGLLKKELRKEYDAVIHAAAVSDFQLARAHSGKLSSAARRINLKLVPTAKLINTIKKRRPETFLIGFKLLTSLSTKSAKLNTRKLIREARCDLVAANSIAGQEYKAILIDSNHQAIAKADTRWKLANKLVNILRQKL